MQISVEEMLRLGMLRLMSCMGGRLLLIHNIQTNEYLLPYHFKDETVLTPILSFARKHADCIERVQDKILFDKIEELAAKRIRWVDLPNESFFDFEELVISVDENKRWFGVWELSEGCDSATIRGNGFSLKVDVEGKLSLDDSPVNNRKVFEPEMPEGLTHLNLYAGMGKSCFRLDGFPDVIVVPVSSLLIVCGRAVIIDAHVEDGEAVLQIRRANGSVITHRQPPKGS